LASREGDQACSAILKRPLAATNRLARLELPDLIVRNGTGEYVLVILYMLGVYRTPTLDPFVEKGYVHLSSFTLGHRCLTAAVSSRGERMPAVCSTAEFCGCLSVSPIPEPPTESRVIQ